MKLLMIHLPLDVSFENAFVLFADVDGSLLPALSVLNDEVTLTAPYAEVGHLEVADFRIAETSQDGGLDEEGISNHGLALLGLSEDVKLLCLAQHTS